MFNSIIWGLLLSLLIVSDVWLNVHVQIILKKMKIKNNFILQSVTVKHLLEYRSICFWTLFIKILPQNEITPYHVQILCVCTVVLCWQFYPGCCHVWLVSSRYCCILGHQSSFFLRELPLLLWATFGTSSS